MPEDPRYKAPGFREAHLEVCKAYRELHEAFGSVGEAKRAAGTDERAKELLGRYESAIARRRAVVRAGREK
ncbi:MAG: hypothetical protein NT137_01370 [Methanomassiliicoccales archaeon]|nr:hypothetical protein [Methanomassiliicoccales archaeon]